MGYGGGNFTSSTFPRQKKCTTIMIEMATRLESEQRSSCHGLPRALTTTTLSRTSKVTLGSLPLLVPSSMVVESATKLTGSRAHSWWERLPVKKEWWMKSDATTTQRNKKAMTFLRNKGGRCRRQKPRPQREAQVVEGNTIKSQSTKRTSRSFMLAIKMANGRNRGRI